MTNKELGNLLKLLIPDIEEVRKITCKAKINGEWVEVPFHGIFQYSDVIEPSPMVGRHNGGVIAYPVAVIELENQLIMRSLDAVKDIRNSSNAKEDD